MKDFSFSSFRPPPLPLIISGTIVRVPAIFADLLYVSECQINSVLKNVPRIHVTISLNVPMDEYRNTPSADRRLQRVTFRERNRVLSRRSRVIIERLGVLVVPRYAKPQPNTTPSSAWERLRQHNHRAAYSRGIESFVCKSKASRGFGQ